jgi:hypothetical protein
LVIASDSSWRDYDAPMAEQMKRVGTELPWKSGSGVPPTGRLEHVVERRTLSRGNRLRTSAATRSDP